MTPQALIFDIDGTLWDSRALVAEGYNLQLRDEGLDRLCVNAEQLRPLFGQVITAIADALLGSIPEGERYGLMERCMARENRYLAENPCDIGYPEIRETLEALAEKFDLYIVSNSQRDYPELCMEKLGIARLIRGHLCFGDTGTPKDQTILRLLREHTISSAMYIGDTQADCDSAHAAGIPFLWAAYGFGKATDYDDMVSQPRELRKLLNQQK
ncbi:MAG TPA: HAD family hydrolase [Candidatus Faecousia intestinigallinarum]|nr:HAD family hydrolase [Candidatus Faecousia intestinigallinarum]